MLKRLLCYCLLSLPLLATVRTSQFSMPLLSSIPIEQKPTDWQIFIKAIAWHESRYNDKAVGPTNDLGYLQLTPIYVKEVNRLLALRGDSVRYCLEDRLDRQKSIDMFNIIQGHYNPSHDKAVAIKLHNHGAGPEYGRSIMLKYKQLLSEL